MNQTEQLAQKEISSVFDTGILPEHSMDVFRKKLSVYINDLITYDFEQLINILYRIDVNEEKVKNLLATSPGTDTGLIIADLILERQIQKIRFRNQFRKTDDNVSDDQRW